MVGTAYAIFSGVPDTGFPLFRLAVVMMVGVPLSGGDNDVDHSNRRRSGASNCQRWAARESNTGYARRLIEEQCPIDAAYRTLELLAQWDREDATDDAAEIARREEQLKELKMAPQRESRLWPHPISMTISLDSGPLSLNRPR